MHKRLERGRFTFPDRVGAATTGVEIDAHELSMLLEGLERKPGRSARRWRPAISRDGLTKSEKSCGRGVDRDRRIFVQR